MKKPSLQNYSDSKISSMPLTKSEIINLAINERRMIKVEWKANFSIKEARVEYIFPLHIFEFQDQEYLIWQRPTEENLDCAPIVAMGPVEMSHNYFMSHYGPEDIEQFQNQWIYFEDGKDIDPSQTVKRVILKIHAPLLMVDFTPLQQIWSRFVVVGTARNELIVSGNGVINQELFTKLVDLGLKVSFMAPNWAQKKFLDFIRKSK